MPLSSNENSLSYTRISTEKHIGEIDYSEYFVDVFGSSEKAKEFVESAETNQKTRIIVHQCARMLYLADKVYQRGRPALDVLFFMIIAEAVAKIIFDFQKDGKSKEHVYKFFNDTCNETTKNKLSKAFKKQNKAEELMTDSFLTLNETIEFLYSVRCDIVHQGVYFDNFYLKENGVLPHWKNLCWLCPNISAVELRAIILEGVVSGCQRELQMQNANGSKKEVKNEY